MPRPRRNEQNRERLLEQGVRSIIANGYHGTGIKEILDDVRVPKGSFYNYFKSKEAFGAEIIRFYADSLFTIWDTWFADFTGNPIDGIKHLYGQKIRQYEKEGTHCGCLIGNLSAELADSSSLCRDALVEAISNWKIRFVAQIAAAQEAGYIRDDVVPEQFANIFWSTWEGSLLRMKVTRSVTPLRHALSFMLDDYLKP